MKAQEAPVNLAQGETLNLRIFLDRSVLEVFANGRQCITQRMYPSRPESRDVLLFSRGGGANVKSLQAWDLVSAHRGGLVCLNSAARFDKWNRAAVR